MENNAVIKQLHGQKERESPPSRGRSCAECQRSKIRCDRDVTVPCSSCVRRGIASICPDGRLHNRGKRIILAGTEDLHSKIEELTQRIHELEDALAKLQAQLDPRPHPLLKGPEEASITPAGSLLVKEGGGCVFYGATSSVEWIMAMEETDSYFTSNEGIEDVTPNCLRTEQKLKPVQPGFPLLMERMDRDDMMERAIAELPGKGMASVLVDSYFFRVTWLVSPIPRHQFLSDHFERCYKRPMTDDVTLQDFALVYAVLALGMAHSVEVPNYAEIAAIYESYSQACLAAGDFATSNSLSVINALFLCAVYHHSRDDTADSHKGSILLGIAFKLAITMGLHREPSLWGLPAEECARRRRTMCEIVSYELWVTLVTGRPPMVSRHYFDVEIPLYEPDAVDSNPNIARKKHGFTQACLWQVIDFILAPSNQTTYSAALHLDSQVRNWRLPNALHTISLQPSEEERTLVNFREATKPLFREIALLCLHRGYFASALLEPPFDPLGSVFARSVLAAFGSACVILEGIRNLHMQEPILTLRCHAFWTYSFSAAVVLGSIAIRAPDCRLAPTSLFEFDRAVDLFKRAQSGFHAGRVLPILLRLQAKAHNSLESYLSGTWTKPVSTDSQLYHGLGASVLVNHTRTPPASNDTSERGSESDLMTSLETAQPSFNEYLGSLGFSMNPEGYNLDVSTAGSGSGAFGGLGNYAATSDDFLHGVVTGQWNGHSEVRAYTSPYVYDYQTAGLAPSWDFRPHHQPPNLGVDQCQDQISPIGNTPFDTLSSSTGNPGSVETRNGAGHNSSFADLPRVPLIDGNGEQVEVPFVWDSFLKELGVGANT